MDIIWLRSVARRRREIYQREKLLMCFWCRGTFFTGPHRGEGILMTGTSWGGRINVYLCLAFVAFAADKFMTMTENDLVLALRRRNGVFVCRRRIKRWNFGPTNDGKSSSIQNPWCLFRVIESLITFAQRKMNSKVYISARFSGFSILICFGSSRNRISTLSGNFKEFFQLSRASQFSC